METDAEAFTAGVQKTMAGMLSALFDLWGKMGLAGAPLEYRLTAVKDVVAKTLGDMIAEEENNINKIVDCIEGHGKERAKLAKELGVSVTDPDPNTGLVQLEHALRMQVSELREAKELRMVEVLDLKRQDEGICKHLAEEPYYISSVVIPSQGQLDALKQHIQDMKATKSKRFGQFLEAKTAIIALLELLEEEPHSSFERDVVCEDEDSFTLSLSNLKAVNDMRDNLEKKVEGNKEAAESMKRRIISLIGKLQLGRNEVENVPSGYTPSDLNELKRILNELEILKSEKLEEFIMATRDELVQLWEQCYYGNEQRSKFKPFYSLCFSEELLAEHEAEVDRIRKYYDAHRDLFQKVSKRRGLWKRMLELEMLQKDPDHLLKAKGNTLLIEERDRKMINKALPKVDEELREEMAEYLRVHNKPFLVGGVPYEKFLEYEISEHQKHVEAERNSKKQAKKQQTLQETLFGSKPVTPAKRALLSATGGMKRKADATGTTPFQKRAREATTPSTDTLGRSAFSRSRTPAQPRMASAKTNKDASRFGLRSQGAPRRALVDRNTDAAPVGNINSDMMTTVMSLDSDFQMGVPLLTSTMQQTPEASGSGKVAGNALLR